MSTFAPQADSNAQYGAHVFAAPHDQSELLELAEFLGNHSSPTVLVGPDGERAALPRAAYEALRQVVSTMERGASVSVEPVDRQLTTRQAAELLGVSRSTLVRLLDENELPFERFGNSRHRRLRLNDVLSYRERKRAQRRGQLDELTKMATIDGLYDVGQESYRAALIEARKS